MRPCSICQAWALRGGRQSYPEAALVGGAAIHGQCGRSTGACSTGRIVGSGQRGRRPPRLGSAQRPQTNRDRADRATRHIGCGAEGACRVRRGAGAKSSRPACPPQRQGQRVMPDTGASRGDDAAGPLTSSSPIGIPRMQPPMPLMSEPLQALPPQPRPPMPPTRPQPPPPPRPSPPPMHVRGYSVSAARSPEYYFALDRAACPTSRSRRSPSLTSSPPAT